MDGHARGVARVPGAVLQAQRDGQTSASLLTSEADIQEGDGTDVNGYNTALHENTSSGFSVPDQTCPSDNWHSDLGRGDLADSAGTPMGCCGPRRSLTGTSMVS